MDTQKQSDVGAWLRENLVRFQARSPKFFKVWGWINKIMLLLSGLPTVIDWAQKTFSFDASEILPGNGMKIVLKIVAFAAAWGLMMNKLTVADPHVIETDNGTLLQKPCADLPFTTKTEAPKIIDPKDEKLS